MDLVPYQTIIAAINDNNLHILTSGQCSNKEGISTSTSTFCTAGGVVYSAQSCPQQRSSNYRAALHGILSALYIIYRAEQDNPQTVKGSVILQRSHKKALREAFKVSPIGVTTATQAHHDLILDIRFLRNLIGSTIHPVQSQVSTDDSPPALDSPDLDAHDSASDHSPLSHVISLRLHGKDIEQDLRQAINEVEYSEPLQRKVMKDTGWSEVQFHAVDWPAYYRAFRRVPRTHRISIMKLTHCLWNTNTQNKRFYGQTDQCPICQKAPETFSHLFQCTHESATSNRQQFFDEFLATLRPTTLTLLLQTLMTGISQWTTNTALASPTSGSRLPTLQVLNQAFAAQSDLGWGACLRSLLSTHWETSFRATYRPTKPLKPA
jgi:hypothetical protein